MGTDGTPRHRTRRTFWVLTLIAVAAAGSLSAAIQSPAGSIAGLRVAGSGLVLVVATALAARLLIFVERARRRAGQDYHQKPSPRR